MGKEINIKVKINDNKILSIVDTYGFSDDFIGRMEIIGILENLKAVELEKIKTTFSLNSDMQVNDEDDDDKSFLIK
jgi:hypothetical protein